jgi:cation:H+ antiporter
VTHLLLLLAAAGCIYLACEWFVNAVEWLGRRLAIGSTAVGTVLAAAGTALPESVVTLVAVTTGHTPAQRDIGVGAAMGGPLVLATVAYAVVGVTLLAARRRPVPAEYGDLRRLRRDQKAFLGIFVVKVALGLVAFAVKPVLGLAFFAAYALYVRRELRGGPDEGEPEALEPLRLQPRAKDDPSTVLVVVQTAGALGVIFAASQLFVHQLGALAPMLGLPTAVTALLLSPVATELPETLNALIWVRQGRPRLALANISGAMMVQATVPSGLGLLFTPWRFTPALLLSGLVTMAAIGYLLWALRERVGRWRLAAAGLFYLVFAAALLALPG